MAGIIVKTGMWEKGAPQKRSPLHPQDEKPDKDAYNCDLILVDVKPNHSDVYTTCQEVCLYDLKDLCAQGTVR